MPNLPQIQGKTPDSKEEVWVAQALYKRKIPFVFHYAVMGGTAIRRGMIVDFLLTHPFPRPLEVYGQYWHEDELPGGDLIRLKALEDFFNIKPLIIWGKDIPTEKDAQKWVDKNL